MFERFTADARATVAYAQDHARRLGHSHIGSEHLLLALVGGQSPAAEVLREHLLTPEVVEEQIVRAVGLGASGGARLDRDALAAVGIDIDHVTAVVEATFGKDALRRGGSSPAIRNVDRRRRSTSRGLRCLVQRGHRPQNGRARGRHDVEGRSHHPATGRHYASAPGPAGHLPFSARAKKALEGSVLQSQSRRDGHLGAEHLALALVSLDDGMIPRILSAAGTSPAALIAAINARYREAG